MNLSRKLRCWLMERETDRHLAASAAWSAPNAVLRLNAVYRQAGSAGLRSARRCSMYEFTGPNQLAQHLAKYVTCASTIHAHCVRDWGHSPDISKIQGWQQMHRRPTRKAIEEPIETDGIIPRLGILPVETPKKAVQMPYEKGKLWPKWYSPPCNVFLVSELVSHVAKCFGITPDQVTGAGRNQTFVHARAVVVRIMRDRGWSFPRIGRHLGNRDHSSMIHSRNSFDIYEKQCPEVRDVYEALVDAGWAKK